MKIGFISDFFQDSLLGGAELNDGVLIEHLKTKHEVVELVSTQCTPDSFHDLDFVILSNFVGLSDINKSYLVDNVPYILYEHDHKYVINRDPSKFKDFIIPKEYLINQKVYSSAKKVVCLSSSQTDTIRKNLNIDNLHNISCSLWSKDRLSLLRQFGRNEKNDKFAIMNSNNPIKNTTRAADFCRKNDIKYDLIGDPDPVRFLETLSGYKGLVFFPGVLESLSRISVEAKMMGCKLLTTPKMLGASYEEWFKLSGPDLIDVMEENVSSALSKFEEIIEG